MAFLTYNSKYIVQSATTVTTSSSTFANDTQATRTFSLGSTQTVLIIYTANSEYLSTNGVGGIKNAINIDGADVSTMNDSGYGANCALRNSCIWVGSLGSGSHTINGRLASVVNAQTTTVDNRTLLIYVFNGSNEYLYINDTTTQSASSTTYIDDSVATTTFTPLSACTALVFYAITNAAGSTERYTGKKICINIDGVDKYGEAAKSSNSAAMSPDSLVTVYAKTLTAAVSTTITGRLATNVGTQTVTVNRHVFGVLLLDPSVSLDLVANVTPDSSTSTVLVNDDPASISLTRSTTSELLVLGQGTRKSTITGSMYGMAYGLNVDGVDVALSRSSAAYTSDAESSFVVYASTEEAGSHTINGRFAANAGTSAVVVSSRILIALCFSTATLIQTTSSISGGGSLTASLSNIKRINSTVPGGGSQTSNLVNTAVNYSDTTAITTYHNAAGTGSSFSGSISASSAGFCFFSLGHATRFTQTGTLKRVRFYAQNTWELATFKISIWSKNESTGLYSQTQITANLKTSIADGYNDIDISSQNLSITEGMSFGICLAGAGGQSCFTKSSSGGSSTLGETRYIGSPGTTDFAWASQAEAGTDITIDIDFLMDSPDIIFLGGSILSGSPLSTAYTDQPTIGGFANSTSIPYKLRTLSGLTYQNMGIYGNRYPDLNTRFAKDVTAKHPTYVVIEGGVDDLKLGTATTDDIILYTKLQIIAAQVANIIPIVILILPAYGANYLTASQSLQADAVNNAIIAYHVQNQDFRIVDARDELGSHNAQTGWTLDTQYNSGSDNVHLNEAGNAIVAQKIYDSFSVTTNYLSSSVSGVGSQTASITEFKRFSSSISGGGSLTAVLFRLERMVSSISGGGALTAYLALPIYNFLLKTNNGSTIKTSDGSFLYTSDTSPSLNLSSLINGGGFEVSSPVTFERINSNITAASTLMASPTVINGAVGISSFLLGSGSETANIIEFERISSSIVSGGGSQNANIIEYEQTGSMVVGGGSETANRTLIEYITGIISAGGSESATIKELEQIISSISGGGSHTSIPLTFEQISSIITATGVLTANMNLVSGTVDLSSLLFGIGSETANPIEVGNVISNVVGGGIGTASGSLNKIIASSVGGGGSSSANLIEFINLLSSVLGSASETANIAVGGTNVSVSSTLSGGGSQTTLASLNKIITFSISGGGTTAANLIEWNYLSSDVSGNGSSTTNPTLIEYIASTISSTGSITAALSLNKIVSSIVTGGGNSTANSIILEMLNSNITGISYSSANQVTTIYMSSSLPGGGIQYAHLSYNGRDFNYPLTYTVYQKSKTATIYQKSRNVTFV